MITLYTFGPAMGLPDPSPFVMKAEMLLKLAGLPYTRAVGGFRQAPKGKLPYISDDGEIIADSTFIRFHMETKYGIDFDQGLDAAARGIGWAVEKMCEDHLYWAVVHARWMDDANFAKGPGAFFAKVPAPVRPVVQSVIRRKIRKTLAGHGLGRHDKAEIEALAKRDLTALADILGDKPYLLGDIPSGADATVFAFVATGLCPVCDTPLRDCIAAQANLVAYHARMMRAYYPDFAKAA